MVAKLSDEDRMLLRAARLLSRPVNRLGPHQYAIQGSGYDHHHQRNVWHVDMAATPPYCDCPAWDRPPFEQYCKHVCYFRFVENVSPAAPAAPKARN